MDEDCDEDDECDLYSTPTTALEKEVRTAMSNSFGFCGHNAVLLFSNI